METEADDRAHVDGVGAGGTANRVSDGGEMEVELRETCQVTHSSSRGDASGSSSDGDESSDETAAEGGR